jgi:hypothetical protein
MDQIQTALVKLTHPVVDSRIKTRAKEREAFALTTAFYKEAGYILRDMLHAIEQAPYGGVARTSMAEKADARILREAIVAELKVGFPTFSVTENAGNGGWTICRPADMSFTAIEQFFAQRSALQ